MLSPRQMVCSPFSTVNVTVSFTVKEKVAVAFAEHFPIESVTTTVYSFVPIEVGVTVMKSVVSSVLHL